MQRFKVKTLRATERPQQLVWLAMHQDYSSDFVYDKRDRAPDESQAGVLIVDKLLKGNRGHYGCYEHPQITFNAGYFPHSTMQQIRTHRVGISIDCMSFRYTSEHIIGIAKQTKDIEDVFYLRPVGNYRDRKGKNYFYSEQERERDLGRCFDAARDYHRKIDVLGYSEEHARSLIPFDVRQHWVMSCNARSCLHLLDLRWKADAQLEAQCFSELLFKEFEKWMPEVAQWYEENRAKKARLAP